MLRIAVIALLLTSGCTHVNRATLLASSASLACDWAQTRSRAEVGWRGTFENNPMLGAKPSVERVDFYFATAIAANVGIWILMPDRFKSVIPLGVTTVQTKTIIGNLPQTGICFR